MELQQFDKDFFKNIRKKDSTGKHFGVSSRTLKTTISMENLIQ